MGRLRIHRLPKAICACSDCLRQSDNPRIAWNIYIHHLCALHPGRSESGGGGVAFTPIHSKLLCIHSCTTLCIEACSQPMHVYERIMVIVRCVHACSITRSGYIISVCHPCMALALNRGGCMLPEFYCTSV